MTGKTKKIEFVLIFYIIYHEKHVAVVCFFIGSKVVCSGKQALTCATNSDSFIGL